MLLSLFYMKDMPENSKLPVRLSSPIVSLLMSQQSIEGDTYPKNVTRSGQCLRKTNVLRLGGDAF
jgi:hypothetical protein